MSGPVLSSENLSLTVESVGVCGWPALMAAEIISDFSNYMPDLLGT